MAAYASYEYYGLTYRGAAIADADYNRLALRASEMIDRLTFDQAGPVVAADEDADLIDLIKRATCAVAEEIQRCEAGVITSERVGNHSATYAVQTITDETRYSRAARRYLATSGLMYRGIDAN